MSFNVLIVDDSAVMRRMIRRALTSNVDEIANVQEACDGGQALRFLDTGEIDLVLTDINMPHIDGTAMLEMMQSSDEFSDIPTVVITANKNQEVLARMKELGVKGCLLKPFRPDHLRTMVMRALASLEG